MSHITTGYIMQMSVQNTALPFQLGCSQCWNYCILHFNSTEEK